MGFWCLNLYIHEYTNSHHIISPRLKYWLSSVTGQHHILGFVPYFLPYALSKILLCHLVCHSKVTLLFCLHEKFHYIRKPLISAFAVCLLSLVNHHDSLGPPLLLWSTLIILVQDCHFAGSGFLARPILSIFTVLFMSPLCWSGGHGFLTTDLLLTLFGVNIQLK